MKNLFLATTLPDWATSLLPILRSVFVVLLLLCAISVIIIVLVTESNPEGGTNVVTGSYDSFYSKNKASTREGRLKRLLIWVSSIAVVCCILYFVTLIIYPVV